MSHAERTGFRSLVYSGWHRTAQVRTLIGAVRAAKLTMVDVDCCEACAYCGEPVALIETEHSHCSRPKDAPITSWLARKAHIVAFSVAYYGDIEQSHCESCNRTDESGSIEGFVVRQIEPAHPWIRLCSPIEYAAFLEFLRHGHQCVSEVDRKETAS